MATKWTAEDHRFASGQVKIAQFLLRLSVAFIVVGFIAGLFVE